MHRPTPLIDIIYHLPPPQLYELCLERLPGYPHQQGYWDAVDRELKSKPMYAEFAVRRANRIQTLRERTVEDLLFAPYLAQVPGEAKKRPGGAAPMRPIGENPVLLTVAVTQVKRGKVYACTYSIEGQEGPKVDAKAPKKVC